VVEVRSCHGQYTGTRAPSYRCPRRPWRHGRSPAAWPHRRRRSCRCRRHRWRTRARPHRSPRRRPGGPAPSTQQSDRWGHPYA